MAPKKPLSGETIDTRGGAIQPLVEHAAADVSTDMEQALGKIRGLESEMAGVIREMQEKVRQLEWMNQFSSILNSTLDRDVIRGKALEATCQLLNCETASLFLVDGASAELYWDTALGETGNELKRTVRLPIDDRSIAGFVAMSGESLVINDVESDPRHFKRTVESSFRARTMLCVPLRAKDQVIGVLQALNKLPPVGTPPARPAAALPAFHENDRRNLETLSHQVSIAIENSRLVAGVKKSFYETVEALAEAIEKKDHYTGGHTKRVVYYSMCICKFLDLAPEQLEQIRLGALLHDVGKIGVEDKILKKEGPLEAVEWKVMQQHPELGYDIMKRVEGLKDVIGGMRYHHERWDGSGYPLGLQGEEIPLVARIISVADTYDAMISTRPYRKGMEPRAAYDEILRYAGRQFDPAIVEAFRQAFESEKMGRGSGGSSLSNCD